MQELLFFLFSFFFHLLYFRLLKIPKGASICFPRVPCLSVVIIGHPVFFYVMTGSAFMSSSKVGTFIITPDRPHVVGGIKRFMDVATFTILIDNFIVFCSSKFSLESIFYAPLSASCRKKNKRCQNKKDPVIIGYSLACAGFSTPGRGKYIFNF